MYKSQMRFKSIFALLLCFLTLAVAFLPFYKGDAVTVKADAPKGEITVFSWEDYIEEGENDDEGVIADFMKEYPDVTVNYYSFATNEEMYNELLKDPTAVDVICPSEYMILKMREEGLIKPYTVPQNFVDYGSPYIKRVFDELGLTTEDGKTYAVGYMWGTMGLIYDAEKFTDDDFNNWTELYDPKFQGKITIKDSLRDSYIMTVAIVYQDELLALRSAYENGTIEDYNSDGVKDGNDYTDKLFEIFNRTDAQTVDKVGDALIELKKYLYGFEVDAGKNDLLSGKIDVNFAWSGDAVYSMWEGDEIGKELCYVVPDEGSNVWFDGWVMTKDADEDASSAFINFMSRPDIAVRNMDYVGYTSCVAGEEVFEYVTDTFGAEYLPEATLTAEEYSKLSDSQKEDYVLFDGGYALSDDGYGRIIFDGETPYLECFTLNQDGSESVTETVELYAVDLKYFFDPDNTDGDYIVFSTETNRHLYAQYADEQTIMRCAVMDNFSVEDLERVNEMWNKVKLITFSDLTIVLIVIGLAFLIACAIVFKFRVKIFGDKIPESKPRRKIKNATVIKVEKLN